MANKRPLVITNGQVQQIQTGDVIDPAFYTGGGGGGATIHTASVDFGSVPVSVKRFSVGHSGATTSQKVMVQVLPTSSDVDEYEWEPVNAQGFVSATNVVDVIISTLNPGGLLSGIKTIGYQLV